MGFSWRGFGNVKPRSTSSNVMEVTTPLRAITYDVVSSPSHGTARILSFLSENNSIEGIRSVLESEDNENPILESADSIIFESEHCCLPGSSKDECSKYLKTLIHEHIKSLKPFSFKI